MNILVCIKQVPDTEAVKLDPETSRLIREGVDNIMNPYDKQALESALILKDAEGAKVTIVTMGPPQAKDVLKEAIAMGADEGVLVSDRALGGSDTLATSYALAAAAKKLGDFDLILCGQQAIDGDTAQVGPEMAEHLDLPQVTSAMKVVKKENVLLVDRDTENYSQTIEVSLPALVTVLRSEKEPRFASIKGKMKARKAKFVEYSAADLEIDLECIGLSGSPTKVKKVSTPTIADIKSEIIKEDDPEVAVSMLVKRLVDAEII